MVWLNEMHHNFPAASGSFGGSKCTCPECNKSLEGDVNKNDETLMDELRSIADECPTRPLGKCLDEAKDVICGERQDVYGKPEDSFELIAEYWSTYLNKYDGKGMHLTGKDVAHMMILFKMARVQGQRPSRDNYIDIAGYVSIAADRLSD